MTAIITNQFRLQNLQYTKRDIDSGVDKYYLAVGRSQPWTTDTNPPTPDIDPKDEMEARLNMHSAKKFALCYNCAISNSVSIYCEYAMVEKKAKKLLPCC